MKNNEISDILDDISQSIRDGKLVCLKEEAEKFCTIYLSYKYPEDAEIGKKKREFEDSIKPKNDKGTE